MSGGGSDADVVVIGAGPAGAAAALVCARAGLDVLVVDREPLPRAKVCGCCLDPAAIEALERLGCAGLVAAEWVVLERARIHAWSVTAELPIRGVVLSRERLDLALVDAARAAGARVRWPARARLGPIEGDRRSVVLSPPPGVDEPETTVRARLVVAACGLGGLERIGAPGPPRARSVRRVGLGALLPAGEVDLEPGVVRMAAGAEGYVGVVRLEDGRIDVAASIERNALRGRRPGEVVRRLLVQAGAPLLPAGVSWSGTPTLRRVDSRRPERVVVVGDAAGFWEPFTGEGIGWALTAAESLAPLARHLAAGGHPTASRAPKPVSGSWILSRQARSRAIAWLAAGPRRARLALGVATRLPSLGRLGSRRIMVAGGRVG